MINAGGKNASHEITALKADVTSDQVNIPSVKFFAHRGASQAAPENTLPAYQIAGEAGFWGAETDIATTSDGVWIVHHDSTVDRMTDGTGAVHDLTLAQIKSFKINAGSNVGYYPNLRIPTLEEFLYECRIQNIVPMIEVKVVYAFSEYDSLVDTIKKTGFEKTVIILCSSLDVLQQIRIRNKWVSLQYLVPFSDQAILDAKSLGGNVAISYDYTTVTKEWVEKAHNQGVAVSVWTVDDISAARSIMIYGVDYITSNKIVNVGW